MESSLFKAVIDEASDEYYLFDKTGKIVYANEAAAKSLGYSLVGLTSLSLSDIDLGYGPDFSSHFEQLRLKQVIRLETEHRTKDCPVIHKEVTSFCFKQDGQEFLSAFAHDLAPVLHPRVVLFRLLTVNSGQGARPVFLHPLNFLCSATCLLIITK